MPIYTKKGDRGRTGLPGDRRRPKTDQLFEVLGSLDQTSATIGLAVAHLNNQLINIADTLQSVQSDLLSIGVCLASESPSQTPLLKTLNNKTRSFERMIDRWEKEMGELKNFIIVGGCPAGASLHLARTTARKAERDFNNLKHNQQLLEISRYLNRLSDLLFQAARFVNYKSKSVETNWNNS